jgi:glutathione S-transferase
MIRISAFRSVPPFAQGAVRDFRVRWALEEAGLPYEVRLLGQGDQKSASYRDLQPFGQVPSFEDGELTLFESGAILLHIAEKSDALMPKDEEGRSRARTWVFAALNTVEPPIQELAGIDLFWAGQAWTKERRPMVEKMVRQRLGELADAMQGSDYLEDRFTAGDLMMSAVLRILRHTEILKDFPSLAAYRARCEARPAFKRAIDAQMRQFDKAA